MAANDAYLTLPARKEGIIPGGANLRLPAIHRRPARPAQSIRASANSMCDSPDGRLICDEIAAPGDMDHALERVVAGLASAGAASATANRRAMRVGQEPLDVFRKYFPFMRATKPIVIAARRSSPISSASGTQRSGGFDSYPRSRADKPFHAVEAK